MNIPYDIIISSNDNATSFVELNNQYNALYERLINNQRQISYLDLYKITEYINTPEEGVQIGSKFAQLNPNTAIGIGVPSIVFNGETFYQGDLLLKLSNGQMQKLDAPSHGIYFPRWKEKGTIRQLIWKYTKDEPIIPNNETEPEPVEMSATNNAELLLFRNIPSVNNENGYGEKIPSTSFTLTNLFYDMSTKPVFSGETITYNDKTIVEWNEGDNKLYYYLYNFPSHLGIRIRKDKVVTCYETEGTEENKWIVLNSFVYRSGDEFTVAKNQQELDGYLTIDWNETDRKWIATYIYNRYGVILTFSEETIKYGEKVIVERNEEDNKLYYYLYNLPNNFGIYIKEENSTCYVTEDETQTFSLNKFVYRNDNNFIEKQEISDDYFTINWSADGYYWYVIYTTGIHTTINCINNLIPIIKCFNENNEEILADINIELKETIRTQHYEISNIPSCVSYLMVR